MEKIKLLIVEDDKFARQALNYEFKSIDSVDVLDAVSNGQEACDFVKKVSPDIILMDIEMPVMNGIEATKYIKEFNPEIGIIMLTSHKERENVLWAFSSGANAYCIKNIKINELLNVIETVKNNGVWFDNQIACFILDVLKNTEPETAFPETKKKAEDYNITARERNIIKLISEGYSNKQICDELFISLSTVKNHITNITKKLSLKDRTQVALFALKNDILK